MRSDSKIYVAGHRGLVGSALVRRLRSSGYSNLITRSHAELDLEQQGDIEDFFTQESPEYVFLAAAKVGGIHANNTYPADFILSNLKIQNNIIEAAYRHGVDGLLFLGSSCIYPKLAPQPLKEEYLLSGHLEPTNEPYAVAKIAGIILCESLNRQYGTRFLSVMPTNLYGPGDNYDLESSHVLPALIRKLHLARLASQGEWDAIERDEAAHGQIPVDLRAQLNAIGQANGHSPGAGTSHLLPPDAALTLWGTGTPRREFLYSDDLADACILLMERSDAFLASAPSGKERSLFNIGFGEDLTIRELSEVVGKVVGFEGPVRWDHTKPDGTPRKLLDSTRLMRLTGWKPAVSLEEGVSLAYRSYLGESLDDREKEKHHRQLSLGE